MEVVKIIEYQPPVSDEINQEALDWMFMQLLPQIKMKIYKNDIIAKIEEQMFDSSEEHQVLFDAILEEFAKEPESVIVAGISGVDFELIPTLVGNEVCLTIKPVFSRKKLDYALAAD